MTNDSLVCNLGILKIEGPLIPDHYQNSSLSKLTEPCKSKKKMCKGVSGIKKKS